MNGSITTSIDSAVIKQQYSLRQSDLMPINHAGYLHNPTHSADRMNTVVRNIRHTLLAALALAAASSQCHAQEAAANADAAYPARLAAASLVLDVITAGNRYVAVGERGHVLLSEDGQEWHQAAQVPTRSNLTAVYFRGGQLWAVGHDSVIIHSADLGETWNLQYSDAEAEQPLMDIVFTDAKHGIAIGAYSLILSTQDGGSHWEVGNMADLLAGELNDAAAAGGEADASSDDEYVDDEYADDGLGEDEEFEDEGIEYHLNAILPLGEDHLLIAAEAGNGYRSDDNGASWYHFTFPYPGSMFGLITEEDGCVLAYGLRGHIQRSCDTAVTWQQLDGENLSSLFGAAHDAGGIALVGANGALVRVTPGMNEAVNERLESGEDLAAVLATKSGLVVAGEDGLSLAFKRSAADGDQP